MPKFKNKQAKRLYENGLEVQYSHFVTKDEDYAMFKEKFVSMDT